MASPFVSIASKSISASIPAGVNEWMRLWHSCDNTPTYDIWGCFRWDENRIDLTLWKWNPSDNPIKPVRMQAKRIKPDTMQAVIKLLIWEAATDFQATVQARAIEEADNESANQP